MTPFTVLRARGRTARITLPSHDPRAVATTGADLFSAVVAVTDTLVAGDVVADNAFGIWTTANVHAIGLGGNRFFDVGTDVFTR